MCTGTSPNRDYRRDRRAQPSGTRTPRSATRRGWGAALASLAVTAACGSDESSVEIALVASETEADPFDDIGYAFDGDDVTDRAPAITVAAGREVVLTLHNRAGQYSPTRASHDLAIVPMLDDLFTVIATGEIVDHVLWGAMTPQLFTDESTTITFVPEEPGTYHYLCTIPGHAQHGMLGTFVVEE